MNVKLVMIGECPRCGKEHTRKPPIDAAACLCKNPDAVLVPLSPALLLPARIYAKFSRLSQLAGVSVEKLVNALLEEAAKEKLKELQAFPSVVVTVKDSTP